ncbi:MAG: 4Fe-4S dicluster domain-containing protein [Dysgonomonas sp.]
MDELRLKAKELFDKGRYRYFRRIRRRHTQSSSVFREKYNDCSKLVFNDKCSGNLAVYLTRKDLVGGKRVGISASYYALKSITQLFDENQLKEENLKIFGLSEDGKLTLFDSVANISTFLKTATPPAKQKDDELIAELDKMSQQERWEFWSDELSKCFKCYACRAACPMCYCTKCIVEVNRPQWISPWSTTLSNIEWQINRVMHMAGRCSDCGTCGSVCPVGIPLAFAHA